MLKNCSLLFVVGVGTLLFSNGFALKARAETLIWPEENPVLEKTIHETLEANTRKLTTLKRKLRELQSEFANVSTPFVFIDSDSKPLTDAEKQVQLVSSETEIALSKWRGFLVQLENLNHEWNRHTWNNLKAVETLPPGLSPSSSLKDALSCYAFLREEAQYKLIELNQMTGEIQKNYQKETFPDEHPFSKKNTQVFLNTFDLWEQHPKTLYFKLYSPLTLSTFGDKALSPEDPAVEFSAERTSLLAARQSEDGSLALVFSNNKLVIIPGDDGVSSLPKLSWYPFWNGYVILTKNPSQDGQVELSHIYYWDWDDIATLAEMVKQLANQDETAAQFLWEDLAIFGNAFLLLKNSLRHWDWSGFEQQNFAHAMGIEAFNSQTARLKKTKAEVTDLFDNRDEVPPELWPVAFGILFQTLAQNDAELADKAFHDFQGFYDGSPKLKQFGMMYLDLEAILYFGLGINFPVKKILNVFGRGMRGGARWLLRSRAPTSCSVTVAGTPESSSVPTQVRRNWFQKLTAITKVVTRVGIVAAFSADILNRYKMSISMGVDPGGISYPWFVLTDYVPFKSINNAAQKFESRYQKRRREFKKLPTDEFIDQLKAIQKARSTP